MHGVRALRAPQLMSEREALIECVGSRIQCLERWRRQCPRRQSIGRLHPLEGKQHHFEAHVKRARFQRRAANESVAELGCKARVLPNRRRLVI